MPTTSQRPVLSRTLIAICWAVFDIGCAERVDFIECQDDTDCQSQPAAVSGAVLYCTHDKICVIGTPIASLCAEVYPPSSPADAIVVGALVNRDYGNDALLLISYKMAIEEINSQRSRPDDAPLALRICEINSDKEDPLKSMQLLSRDPHVVAVVGPSNSRDVVAIKDAVVSSGIPIVSAAATAPELSLLGDKDGPANGLFYRVVTSDVKQGPVLAGVALQKVSEAMVAPQFSLIYADDPYGRGLQASVVERLGSLGYFVRPISSYVEPVGGPDRQTIDTKVDLLFSSNPNFLLAIPNRHSVALLQSIALHPKSQQILQIIMGEGGKNESVIQLCNSPIVEIKNILDRISGSAPTVNALHPLYVEFATKFQQVSSFSANSTVFTTFAYDALYTIALAIGATAPDITARRVRMMLGRINGCLVAPTMKRHISVGKDNYAEGRRSIETQSVGLVLDGLSGEICFTPHGDRVDGNYEHWWIDKEEKVFKQNAVP